MALSVVVCAELSRRLVQVNVCCEDGSTSFPLVANNLSVCQQADVMAPARGNLVRDP